MTITMMMMMMVLTMIIFNGDDDDHAMMNMMMMTTINTCHLPMGDSPHECVVMKAQFVKPEEEKSWNKN